MGEDNRRDANGLLDYLISDRLDLTVKGNTCKTTLWFSALFICFTCLWFVRVTVTFICFLWPGLSAFVALHSIRGCGFSFLFLLSHYMHLCYMTKRPNCLFAYKPARNWMGRASFSFRFVPYTHRWKKLGGIVVWEKKIQKGPKTVDSFSSVDICGGLIIAGVLRIINQRGMWRIFLSILSWCQLEGYWSVKPKCHWIYAFDSYYIY